MCAVSISRAAPAPSRFLLFSLPSSLEAKRDASTEGNPNATPTRPASRKRQRQSSAVAAPSAKSARWLNCKAGTLMERLDIEESMVRLLQSHRTVRQNLEEAEEKQRQVQEKRRRKIMYVLQMLAGYIDREAINHDAIRSFLDKERVMQELSSEPTHGGDTLYKDLQLACDSELEEVDDKVENIREENRVLTSKVKAIMDCIGPFAQYC
ncbi:uncharacterized protein FTJAE_14200 [Fusarium tjaetaba]|uniref:Uncharacterized protein n=1 Tax=Fusarium tjaetaba TaxID=1567544 RepID=A0A8H5V777_9HYPO|nr:uncharacterized protein FTJAE_14200 [Fusarium tjaetaba]KAF5611345.1 hypothetical protein FTJAE_14200 [Fusarium tjaetaba]